MPLVSPLISPHASLPKMDAAQVEADLKGSYTALEAQRLSTLVAEREAQLVALVRELYGLAAAERVPGVVAHEARARVFRRCARTCMHEHLHA